MRDFVFTLNKDLSLHKRGTLVCVTGIIHKRWQQRGRFGVEIVDLTGNARVSFVDAKITYDKNSLIIGKRLRAWGEIALDKQGNLFVGSINKIELLEEISLLNSELDIIEQESLISVSKICNTIREQLNSSNFVEIASRLISRRIGKEILEPLMVHYPGFGSPIFLSPSPSSQLSEFLTVTMLPKVFTATSSFSSSYRFPNGASEMPIIMAKAINLSKEEETKAILDTASLIVESLSDDSFNVAYISNLWDNHSNINHSSDGMFSLVSYAADIPTIGKFWNSVVYKIKHLYDDNGNILIECMHEKVSERIDICSITYYPSQFLNWISKAPKRQILNLWKVYDGGDLFG